ncbi:DUF418 domain-containing protein [Nocardiopsis sp. N85]|uniref:DUF418 domain-containing protein n=1 Tax=Nocardiopsis sp. N85 TaxID=3029400 RepID=UPI00237F0509|nr:DUF418 domain-containing protein [Nocardiopsis sp. N85]MDE3719900.1 DUF418 domain-containing protein [Nocardiopsis sp. N85]
MASHGHGRATPSGGGTPAGRSPAPDLSRGFMLLFIALVNAQFFLTGPDPVRSLADQIVTFVQSTLVNGRAIPLFALLFGYGAVMITRRVRAAGGGWIHVRLLLRRRGWVLLALGFAHGALLLPVDILGAYGLALVLFAGLVRARDATLLWTAGVVALVSTVLALVLTVMMTDPGAEGEGGSAAVPSLVETSFSAATVERFHEWVLYTPVTLLLVAMPMIALGMWVGHRRILEEPEAHRRTLRSAAVWGLGAAVVTGLPDALVGAEVLTVGPYAEGVSAVVHDVGGWPGGIGWAALITLLAIRPERSGSAAGAHGPVVSAVAAVGERSLSCYLAQSVVFTLVFAPYGAGLGASLGAAATAAVAVVTWVGCAIGSEALRRADRRGPAEVLVRRLVRGADIRVPAPGGPTP